MDKTVCVIAGSLLFAPMFAQPDTGSSAERLAAMRGKFRPLLIFYPQTQDARSIAAALQSQLNLLRTHELDLKERDVVVMLVPEGLSGHDAKLPQGRNVWEQFGVAPKEFTVLLVGKDGGEKFRSHAPVTIEKLDALIDMMVTMAAPPPRVYIAPPEVPTPLPQIIEALRTITPLQGLSDAEYAWIATHGTEYVGDDGAIIFVDGGPCDKMHLILKGEIHVRRGKGSAAQIFIGRAGQMTGKIPFSRMKTYGGDGYCVGTGWSLTIPEEMFPEMLAAIPSMTQRCVSTLLDRTREVTRMEQQGEKLVALGKLAGNLAHELNNPASAAQRAAASLFGDLREYGQKRHELGKRIESEEQDAALKAWYDRTRRQMCEYCENSISHFSPLVVADREDELAAWLEAHGVPDPWSLAPSLAESPLTIAQLDELAEIASPELLSLGIPAFAMSLRVERMAETVIDSTVRIFDLISAIKDYSYMDQAPIQDVDLADSLERTLAMFHSQLQSVTVERDYDPALPRISAYGSELNQVWTVLVENALEAIEESVGTRGVLRLTTKLSGQSALVEIWDNGKGIPPELASRVFEPFFTTKAPGRGLGLGLDTAQRIVQKHSGQLRLQSKPGATCFQVRLPLNQAQAY